MVGVRSDYWDGAGCRMGVANNVADATDEVGSFEKTATVDVDAP